MGCVHPVTGRVIAHRTPVVRHVVVSVPRRSVQFHRRNPRLQKKPPLVSGQLETRGVSSVGAEGAQQCFTKGIRPPKAAGEMPTEETPLFRGRSKQGGFLLWNYTDYSFSKINPLHWG